MTVHGDRLMQKFNVSLQGLGEKEQLFHNSPTSMNRSLVFLLSVQANRKYTFQKAKDLSCHNILISKKKFLMKNIHSIKLRLPNEENFRKTY